ncbi:hypothetical protein [Shouchella clausii]|uniref:hypothetical protein n=1 Tax=Shouchella clausii TaxID=79880 RepID=UPI000BA6AC81|nr:hypothetical protein [Shouchella clausii]PAD47533.1 hypothetical protein CHI09_06580 [Shouchella clausii]
MLGISKFRLMLVETKRMIILDLFNQFKKSLAFLKERFALFVYRLGVDISPFPQVAQQDLFHTQLRHTANRFFSKK